MLFVFLSKKLISTDTICPLLIRVKQRSPRQPIILFTLDAATTEEIRKNVVLDNFITKNTTVVQLGGSLLPVPFNYFQRVLWIFFLLIVHTLTLFKIAKIFHFGALEKWPYRLVSLLNKSRIFFFESNCWGYSPTVVKVDQAYSTNSRSANTHVNSSNTLLGFSRDWPLLDEGVNSDKRKYLLEPSRSWGSWHNYLENDCRDIWETELKRLGLKSSKQFVFFALGAIEQLPYLDFGDKKIYDVVEYTARTILSISDEIVLLLKPHPITNLRYLDKVIHRLKSDRVKISYLHPSLISKHAIFGICNYYSTTMADCKNAGIPSIEFTKYAKFTLEITQNKSLRPEHVSLFISIDDPDKLTKIVEEIIEQNARSDCRQVLDQREDLDPNILKIIA